MIKLLVLLSFMSASPLEVPLEAESENSKGKDSVNVLHAHGKLRLVNMGFAPVPAFSFNSPIMIGAISIEKKRFSYEGDASLGLNGKPWLSNHWLRYKVVAKESLSLHIGVDGSLFFYSGYTNAGEEFLQVQRNLNFELAANIKTGEQSAFQITLWHIKGCDPGALSGNVFDVGFSPPVVRFIKTLHFKLEPHVFYFNFTGPIDGIYSSVTSNLSHTKIPLSVYVQCVQPLWTGFPGNHFKWNAGIVYSF